MTSLTRQTTTTGPTWRSNRYLIRPIEKRVSMDLLAYDEAKELYEYDPDYGILKERETGKYLQGSLRSDGTVGISVKGRTVLAHRLAWLLSTGEWPDGMVSHINGDKSDNRFENLTLIKPYTDVRAVKEIAGISFVKKTQRYKAVIHNRGRQHYLGEHETKEEAVLTRYAAEQCLGVSVTHEKSASAWIKENLWTT